MTTPYAPAQAIREAGNDDRVEVHCSGCGYGAVVAQPPVRCPMCGHGTWRVAAGYELGARG